MSVLASMACGLLGVVLGFIATWICFFCFDVGDCSPLGTRDPKTAGEMSAETVRVRLIIAAVVGLIAGVCFYAMARSTPLG